MTEPVKELQREIEQGRARLDHVIDRIQDRLSVSGIVDEVMGSLRSSDLGPKFDDVLDVVRRNPLPVALIATGLGWLAYRMSQDEARRLRTMTLNAAAEKVPVLNTGNTRVYDPDHSPLHPAQDALESRRDASARA